MSLDLQSLLAALRRGALLGVTSAAACACAGTSDATKTAPIGDASTQSLSPYPTDGLGCSGPSLDGGYFGQCCQAALCYTPDSGVCASASAVGSRELAGYPPGSGACTCSTTTGPYAPHGDEPPASSGSCCYLVGSIGCTGRPFTTPGGVLLAAVEQRSDWARPMLELRA